MGHLVQREGNMRYIIIEKLIEDKIQHAKNKWHWGNDKLKVHEHALRLEYCRLTDEQLLDKLEEMYEEFYTSY